MASVVSSTLLPRRRLIRSVRPTQQATLSESMRLISNLIVMLCALHIVHAEEVRIPVPGHDWSITLDAPHFDTKRDNGDKDNFQFKANSGRFNISIFVEPQAGGGGSKECYEHYWPMSARNPVIQKATVKASNTDKYYKVDYMIEVAQRGETIRQRNANYYFMFKGRWVDVHISMINPTDEDAAVFTSFDKALRYGESK